MGYAKHLHVLFSPHVILEGFWGLWWPIYIHANKPASQPASQPATLPTLWSVNLISSWAVSPPGENVPVEEQFDKEKANAEVLALDNVINDKPASTPNVPGVRLTDVEKDKCEAELAKLYKQMDDKVRQRGERIKTNLWYLGWAVLIAGVQTCHLLAKFVNFISKWVIHVDRVDLQ